MSDSATQKTSGKRKTQSTPCSEPSVEDWLAQGKEGMRLQCLARHLPVKGMSLQAMAQSLVDKGIVPPPLDSERGEKRRKPSSQPPAATNSRDAEALLLEDGGEGPSSRNEDPQDNDDGEESSSSERDPHPKQDDIQAQFAQFRKEMQRMVAGELQKITSKRNGVVEAATPAPSFSGQALRNASNRLPAAGSLVHLENQDGSSSEDEDDSESVITTTNDHPNTNSKNIIRQHRDRNVENPLPAVPKHILKKIKSMEYVNLDFLLPPSIGNNSLTTSVPMNDVGEFDIRVNEVDGSPSISLCQKETGRGKVRDFKTWTLAWSNYVRCMLHYFPYLAQELCTYLAHIAQFACQYVFSAVYAFDQTTRLHLANNNHRRWDVIDDMIFNTHLRGAPGPSSAMVGRRPLPQQSSTFRCFKCGDRGHFANHCKTQPQSQVRNESATTTINRTAMAGSTSSSTCHRFNRGVACHDRCSYPHKCSICGKSQHAANRCPFSHQGGSTL